MTDEPFLTTSFKNLERQFSVNFMGSFIVAQACANSMVKKSGRIGATKADGSTSNGCIVFIGSIPTHIASTAQNLSAYIASKRAVMGLVQPLATEVAPYGIRVNSLSPGYMMTDMMRGLQSQQPDLVRQLEKETLFGRIGDPEELKGPMLWLCSPAAGGIQGRIC